MTEPNDEDRKAAESFLHQRAHPDDYEPWKEDLAQFRADGRVAEQKRLVRALRDAAKGGDLEYVFSVLLEWADNADKVGK